MKIKVKMLAILGVTILLCSCNHTSKDKMAAANADLKEASKDLKEAAVNLNEADKAKAIEDWYAFRKASDTTIAGIENEVILLRAKITKADQKEKKNLEKEYNQTQEKLNALKVKLNQRNADFENELIQFNESVSVRNESFKREYRHDLEEFRTSVKDFFKDNVK
jgi:hypothetical protein